MTNEHPSYFELDRLALGATEDEATKTHVARCTRCSEYVESVQPTDMPMPLSLHRLQRRPSRARAVALGVMVPLLAAAAVLLMLRVGRVDEVAVVAPPEEPYVGVRGTPAIGLYVRRETGIALWDGTSRFSAGDTIRIKVIPEGFRYVRVFSLDGRRATKLYGGPLELDDAGEALLPPAWQLDDANARETLVVVLSHDERTPVPEATLEHDRDGRALWVRRFVLQK